jgi:hypothetical protein
MLKGRMSKGDGLKINALANLAEKRAFRADPRHTRNGPTIKSNLSIMYSMLAVCYLAEMVRDMQKPQSLRMSLIQ